MLTGGGPSNATMTFPVFAYYSLQNLNIGEAGGSWRDDVASVLGASLYGSRIIAGRRLMLHKMSRTQKIINYSLLVFIGFCDIVPDLLHGAHFAQDS